MESQKQTILIVDDVPENLEILGHMLRTQYEVKIATNGFDALQIASGPTPPDLILLDILMPIMDGYEVCTALKNNPETRDIPIIFLSALNNEVDELVGLGLGAVDYITKPIVPRLLELRVRNLLALRFTQLELKRALAEASRLRNREPETVIEPATLEMTPR